MRPQHRSLSRSLSQFWINRLRYGPTVLYWIAGIMSQISVSSKHHYYTTNTAYLSNVGIFIARCHTDQSIKKLKVSISQTSCAKINTISLHIINTAYNLYKQYNLHICTINTINTAIQSLLTNEKYSSITKSCSVLPERSVLRIVLSVP